MFRHVYLGDIFYEVIKEKNSKPAVHSTVHNLGYFIHCCHTLTVNFSFLSLG